MANYWTLFVLICVIALGFLGGSEGRKYNRYDSKNLSCCLCKRFPVHPVCAAGGVTFRNQCFLDMVQEHYASAGTEIPKIHDGPCNYDGHGYHGASDYGNRQQRSYYDGKYFKFVPHSDPKQCPFMIHPEGNDYGKHGGSYDHHQPEGLPAIGQEYGEHHGDLPLEHKYPEVLIKLEDVSTHSGCGKEQIRGYNQRGHYRPHYEHDAVASPHQGYRPMPNKRPEYHAYPNPAVQPQRYPPRPMYPYVPSQGQQGQGYPPADSDHPLPPLPDDRGEGEYPGEDDMEGEYVADQYYKVTTIKPSTRTATPKTMTPKFTQSTKYVTSNAPTTTKPSTGTSTSQKPTSTPGPSTSTSGPSTSTSGPSTSTSGPSASTSGPSTSTLGTTTTPTTTPSMTPTTKTSTKPTTTKTPSTPTTTKISTKPTTTKTPSTPTTTKTSTKPTTTKTSTKPTTTKTSTKPTTTKTSTKPTTTKTPSTPTTKPTTTKTTKMSTTKRPTTTTPTTTTEEDDEDMNPWWWVNELDLWAAVPEEPTSSNPTPSTPASIAHNLPSNNNDVEIQTFGVRDLLEENKDVGRFDETFGSTIEEIVEDDYDSNEENGNNGGKRHDSEYEKSEAGVHYNLHIHQTQHEPHEHSKHHTGKEHDPQYPLHKNPAAVHLQHDPSLPDHPQKNSKHHHEKVSSYLHRPVFTKLKLGAAVLRPVWKVNAENAYSSNSDEKLEGPQGYGYGDPYQSPYSKTQEEAQQYPVYLEAPEETHAGYPVANADSHNEGQHAYNSYPVAPSGYEQEEPSVQYPSGEHGAYPGVQGGYGQKGHPSAYKPEGEYAAYPKTPSKYGQEEHPSVYNPEGRDDAYQVAPSSYGQEEHPSVHNSEGRDDAYQVAPSSYGQGEYPSAYNPEGGHGTYPVAPSSYGQEEHPSAYPVEEEHPAYPAVPSGYEQQPGANYPEEEYAYPEGYSGYAHDPSAYSAGNVYGKNPDYAAQPGAYSFKEANPDKFGTNYEGLKGPHPVPPPYPEEYNRTYPVHHKIPHYNVSQYPAYPVGYADTEETAYEHQTKNDPYHLGYNGNLAHHNPSNQGYSGSTERGDGRYDSAAKYHVQKIPLHTQVLPYDGNNNGSYPSQLHPHGYSHYNTTDNNKEYPEPNLMHQLDSVYNKPGHGSYNVPLYPSQDSYPTHDSYTAKPPGYNTNTTKYQVKTTTTTKDYPTATRSTTKIPTTSRTTTTQKTTTNPPTTTTQKMTTKQTTTTTQKTTTKPATTTTQKTTTKSPTTTTQKTTTTMKTTTKQPTLPTSTTKPTTTKYTKPPYVEYPPETEYKPEYEYGEYEALTKYPKPQNPVKYPGYESGTPEPYDDSDEVDKWEFFKQKYPYKVKRVKQEYKDEK